ncbi:MAG: MFS transporter [Oscillatoriaceae bacterium SKW80]|nr:MFS transporter [Oscillatoriaceae bacterium SKYG93]MCX8120885.1 MFS transporter [Oscillatoriaceae bacterium SKW80]MDW8452158.1 MFS transporter [Oscillatoriaceae cyanobacterium SKYGB_i_bin93]HIK27368.1 MFS transporter [Oscillatoriaceae cyanobacterium M7585_C2015_266]
MMLLSDSKLQPTIPPLHGNRYPHTGTASCSFNKQVCPHTQLTCNWEKPPYLTNVGIVSEELEEQDNNSSNTKHLSSNGIFPTPHSPLLPEPEEEGFLSVLKNRNFLSLWSGQVFSQLADKVYLVLTIALIASHFRTGGNTISSWVSAITIAFTIPAVLLGSLAGAFVDRWSKKAVLVVTNLLRGFLVLMLPALLWLSEGKQFLSLPLGFCLLLLVTFLVSTLTQFFTPAEQSAIPLVVERHQLLSANSLYTTTMMASVIIGFAVGEPLLALADRVIGKADLGKELVVGGSYTIAGLILLLLSTREKINPTERESPHIFEDIRDGLVYLKENRRVRAALIQLVILFSVFAALAVLAVRLAELIPGMKASQFGILLAAGGVGMAVGAAVVGYVGRYFSYRQLSLAGSIGMAATLIALCLFGNQLWPDLLAIAFLGIFAAVVGVPMQTAIQAETPDEMRGKVFGLQNNLINIALSLPLALAGVAEAFLGLKVVFLGLAVLASAGGLLTWYISGTGIRNFTHAK